MEWQFWVIMLSILLLSIAMLCGVVCCAMRCFYPKGTRGPKALCCPRNGKVGDSSGQPANEPELHLMRNGELAWKEQEVPSQYLYQA